MNRQIVSLKGKTQKGKNRVRELGAQWQVEREADSVLFNDDPGPWLLIVPLVDPTGTKFRWLKKFHDQDFDITFI
jgi:hypothetical protein